MPLGRSDRGHAIAQLVYEHSVHLKLGQVRSVPNKRVGAADNRCARYWRKGDSNPYASQPLFSVIELQLVHHGELLARLSDYAAHPARHTPRENQGFSTHWAPRQAGHCDLAFSKI